MENRNYKHLFILFLLFIILWGCNSNKKNRLYLTNKSHWTNLIIDIDKERFCFYGIDAGLMGAVFSRGKVEKEGDTLVLKSDFNHQKVPLDVRAKTNHKISNNVIGFRYVLPLFTKNKKTLIENYRGNMVIVINDSIEINLINKKIEYKGIVDKFYIKSVEGGSENFRTESYINRDSSNIFTLTFHANFLYSYYKGIDSRLLISNDTIKVLNKNSTLYQTNYDDLRKNVRFKRYCPCWYSNGKVKLHKRLLK